MRADKNDRKVLCDTFVNVGALIPTLKSKNSHVLYGRRGTGKTHVLSYLQSLYEDKDNCAIYVDLRTIGSSGSLYDNQNIPFAQRFVRLIIDVFHEINNQILLYVTKDDGHKSAYLYKVTPVVEKINDCLSTTRLDGMKTQECTIMHDSFENSQIGLSLGVQDSSFNLRIVRSKI